MKNNTQIEKPKYILELLNKNKKKISLPYKEIEKINSAQKIRDYKFKNIETKLIQYEGLLKEGRTINFYGHYSSEKTRKFLTQWLFIDFLTKNGFSKPPLLVPNPILYMENINFFIREDVKGSALLEYLKENNSQDLKKILEKTAQWLLKFQQININNKKIFTPVSVIEAEEFSHYLKVGCEKFSKKLCATIEHVLAVIHKHTSLYDIKNKQSTLVHGDFQPTNVVYNKENNNLTTIDFDWSGVGDPLSDVGNFIFQLGYHSSQYLTQKEIVQYKKIFLNSYFKKAPTKKQQKRVAMYQAKFAIQRVIFNAEFLIPASLKSENDPTVKILIKQVLQNIS